MRGWRLILALTFVGAVGAATDAAAAKPYRASRFDVTLGLGADGSMVVTERIVFEFGADSFTTVFRDVPTRRTDGILDPLGQHGRDRIFAGHGAGTIRSQAQ